MPNFRDVKKLELLPKKTCLSFMAKAHAHIKLN